MYPMRINYSYSSEGLHVDEESNVNASRFFELLKDSDELLWDESTNHSLLSIVARVFTVKFDYDSMVEWVKNILPEENRLKENFYTVKSMMKPFDLEY